MAQPSVGPNNGHDEEIVRYQEQLADYLQERIKPGLNRGAIPLLARSIAREVAHWDAPDGAADVDDQPNQDADDFEAEMHDLQADLGEDWILRFSVHGEDAWLTAEKEDGSQRLEAPNAAVLFKAVKLLDARGGRSG
jgi:hypothetical protein